jgi:hypothetical protein
MLQVGEGGIEEDEDEEGNLYERRKRRSVLLFLE